MDVPIGFGDRVDGEKAVLATFRDKFGQPFAHSLAVDDAVDDDMRDVDAERPVFTRHALRDPYLVARGRWGYRLGDGQLYDSVLRDGLNDAFSDEPSGWHIEGWLRLLRFK
jgi:hypothetical protein